MPFDPLVQEWFAQKFSDVTEPQRLESPSFKDGMTNWSLEP